MRKRNRVATSAYERRHSQTVTQCSGTSEAGSATAGESFAGPARNHLFARLFSENVVPLRRFVMRFVRSRQTADEIVQEAFLRTFEHAGNITTPRAFLFSTARNLALNVIRHDRVAQTELVEDFDDMLSDTAPESLESVVVSEERSRILREAVQQLSPQCRTALSLKVFYSYSYKDISEKMGVVEKTVENHIARGIRETNLYLRERFKQELG